MSEYAGTNTHEMLAEAFASYYRGELQIIEGMPAGMPEDKYRAPLQKVLKVVEQILEESP